MIYNRPETVYYKAAKKLLHAGLKITNVDKLRATPQLLPLLSQITPEELGCDDDSSADEVGDENMKPHVEVVTNIEPRNIKFEPSDEMVIDDAVETFHE